MRRHNRIPDELGVLHAAIKKEQHTISATRNSVYGICMSGFCLTGIFYRSLHSLRWISQHRRSMIEYYRIGICMQKILRFLTSGLCLNLLNFHYNQSQAVKRTVAAIERVDEFWVYYVHLPRLLHRILTFWSVRWNAMGVNEAGQQADVLHMSA